MKKTVTLIEKENGEITAEVGLKDIEADITDGMLLVSDWADQSHIKDIKEFIEMKIKIYEPKFKG